MRPGNSLAKSSPVSSGIGKASMSPRKRIVRPLCEPGLVPLSDTTRPEVEGPRLTPTSRLGLRLTRFSGRFLASNLNVGHVGFVGYWRPVSQTGMQPRRIVPTLDVAEAGHLGFGLGCEPAAAEQLRLEGGEETLGHGIVIGITDRSHRRANPCLAAPLAECHRRILAALVAMVDDVLRP